MNLKTKETVLCICYLCVYMTFREAAKLAIAVLFQVY